MLMKMMIVANSDRIMIITTAILIIITVMGA